MHRVSVIASPRSMISSCSMINPLQVSFPRERSDGNLGLCSGFSFARGRLAPAAKPSWLPAAPSTSAILMFYRADFPSEPAVGPEFRLEGPSIRTHQPLAKAPMLETPRTFLRFSRKRSAASGLPAWCRSPKNEATSANGGSASKRLKAPALISQPFHGDRSPTASPRSTDNWASTMACAATVRPLRPPRKSTSSYEGTYRTALVRPKPW